MKNLKLLIIVLIFVSILCTCLIIFDQRQKYEDFIKEDIQTSLNNLDEYKLKDLFSNFRISNLTSLNKLNLSNTVQLLENQLKITQDVDPLYFAFHSVVNDKFKEFDKVSVSNANRLFNEIDDKHESLSVRLTKQLPSKVLDNYPIGPTNNKKILELQKNTQRQDVNLFQNIGNNLLANYPSTLMTFRNKDSDDIFYNILDLKIEAYSKDSDINFLDHISTQETQTKIEKGEFYLIKGSKLDEKKSKFELIANQSLDELSPEIELITYKEGVIYVGNNNQYLIPSVILGFEFRKTNTQLDGFYFEGFMPVANI